MRDKLIELLGDYLYSEQIADHLLKNGVIVPPCKAGDTVWAIIKDRVAECQIHHYKIFGETLIICFEEKPYRGRHYEWSDGYMGVTLFKTKEEALSKLQASYKQVKGGAER
jgi:hypothetical protein